jgi:hypothetical protein
MEDHFSKREEPVVEIIDLQQQVSKRLVELGYDKHPSSETLSRQLAGIAVLGKRFSETTLPLFIALDRNHAKALAQLAESLRSDLDELLDSISDVQEDLINLTLHLRNGLSTEAE